MTGATVIATWALCAVAATGIAWLFQRSDARLQKREAELLKKYEALSFDAVLERLNRAEQERAESLHKYVDELLAEPLPTQTVTRESA